jgi:cytochrome P450
MIRRAQQPWTLSLGLGHLLQIRHDQLNFYERMRARHGDVVRLRLGPYRSWLLFHPDDLEQVLTGQWQSFIRFEKLTQVVSQWTGENMLLAEGAEWRERRRKVLPAFQSRRLPAYGHKAVRHATLLANSLDEQADPDGSIAIEVDAVMARLTLDIAASTLFGSDPPDNGGEVERAIRELSETAFRESTSPLTLPDWLPLPAKRCKKDAMAVMDRLVGGLVDRRLGMTARDHGDLLSILVAQHEGDRTAIRNDAMALLIAGHETSGALLSWAYHCLANAPDWRTKLAHELRSELDGREPCSADLARLPLLRATVDEVLRLYPPAYSLFLRRATEDVGMEGFTIRRGDLVQIAPIALHRDPRWFTEPTSFVPGRFLQAATWPRYAYLPFGSGPRSCIGQSFGLMEACLVLATLLQRWLPDQSPEATPEPRFSLRPRGGLPMRWLRV